MGKYIFIHPGDNLSPTDSSGDAGMDGHPCWMIDFSLLVCYQTSAEFSSGGIGMWRKEKHP
jgi:hypothetical protein